MAWEGMDPHALSLVLQAFVREAIAGPCRKSRRGALLLADNMLEVGVNRRADGRPCTGSAECRAACAQICNHAEEAAVVAAMRRRARLENVHVLHVAIGEDDKPRSDKITPSCITCSRLMLAAGVSVVWLWGLTGARHEWCPWPIRDFHEATLRNCGLPGADAEVGYSTADGARPGARGFVKRHAQHPGLRAFRLTGHVLPPVEPLPGALVVSQEEQP